MAVPIYFTGPNNDARPVPGQAAGSFDFSEKEILLTRAAGGAMLRFRYRMQLGVGMHITKCNHRGHRRPGQAVAAHATRDCH